MKIKAKSIFVLSILLLAFTSAKSQSGSKSKIQTLLTTDRTDALLTGRTGPRTTAASP